METSPKLRLMQLQSSLDRAQDRESAFLEMCNVIEDYAHAREWQFEDWQIALKAVLGQMQDRLYDLEQETIMSKRAYQYSAVQLGIRAED